MTTKRVQSQSPQETVRLGVSCAGLLSGGEVLLLEGELGSGKTTFVKGLAEGLGVPEAVTSPSFVVGNLYRGTQLKLAHLDMYRLGDLAAEDPATYADFTGPDTVTVIEWPKMGIDTLPVGEPRFTVVLGLTGPESRSIELTGPEPLP